MIDAGFNLITNAELLIRAATAVIVSVIILATLIKTRALIPVVVSMVVGGLVLWGVTMNGAGWFGSRINDDANKLAAPAAAVVAVVRVDVGVV